MNESAIVLEKGEQFQPGWSRVVLASIGDAVITTDTTGCVTYLNSVAESLTGWTLKEATGQPIASVFRIINEESRLPVESPTVRAHRDGVVVGLANHTLRIAKNGSEQPIDDSAAPIRNDKGEIVGVVLVFRDITERRRQEHTTNDALHYAENIIATVREPLVVLDRSLRVRTANASFYRSFQVSKTETEGRFVYDLGNGQWNIPELRAGLENVLPINHSFQDYAVEHNFPSIGRKKMLLNARCLVAENGRPGLILLAIEDITARSNAEIAVQTSEVRYRRLFETAKDGILILDADTGKILEANPFMTELLGYTRDEFVGKELWEIGLFSDKSGNEAAFRDLQQHGYVRYDHLPLNTKGGQEAEVEFISNVYQVGQRHVAQCNIRDISERSRLDRKVTAQAAELSDLHHRKDEFLAMLGHELRNPLAPILNAVQLLRLQGDESGLQQRAHSIIERQLGQLVHLVDDLLEVSRIATGRIHLQQEKLDMRAIVERGVETVRPLIEQRRHALEVHLPPSAIWIDGDATRLEQVVVNLLNNAAKFTDEGGHIWLSLQHDGNEAVLQVRDSGVGIAPELMPRIFELFTQGERSLARSQGGLGIGLALVQRLVEMHGGKVAAQSSLGHGSEFVVRLPVVLGSNARPSPATQSGQPAARALRVLVVDDNLDTVESLALLLLGAGHDVRTAHDGPKALEAALDYRPSVIMLDIGLPGLDGFEVAKRIRKQPNLHGIVLVAMTGYGQETDRQRSLEAGFDHHLVKPARFELVQKILASVSQSGIGSQGSGIRSQAVDS
jgi:PAS domain S-box-containing protein